MQPEQLVRSHLERIEAAYLSAFDRDSEADPIVVLTQLGGEGSTAVDVWDRLRAVTTLAERWPDHARSLMREADEDKVPVLVFLKDESPTIFDIPAPERTAET